MFKKLIDEYTIKVEEIDPSENGTAETFLMYSVYTKDGHYVGSLNDAQRIEKYDLTQVQPAHKDDTVCSIGFSIKEQKWYGWSHRAIYGFGIGSKVEKGDCAYQPANKEEFIENTMQFWADEYNTCELDKIGETSFTYYRIYNDKVPNERMRNTRTQHTEEFPKTYGKGEWTAQTLEDAKQMAIDFAKGVS